MRKVLWLDDQPDRLHDLAISLQSDLDISLVSTEAAAIRQLESGSLPDIFLQDLNRRPTTAQFSFLPDRNLPDSPHIAGWAFYCDALLPALPQLPVVIVTWDGETPRNRQTAEDFNLTIVRKGGSLRERLLDEIGTVLKSQRILLPPRLLPAIVAVDFEKINAVLVTHLANHPSDLDKLSWSGFEELIAVLLKELGYEVTRTKLTRDGGVDLWALQRSDLGETLYAIDAKKYSRRRLLGPEPVRAIYGVADMSGATAGMIVTTSTFGPEAMKLAAQYRYRIALKDFNAVTEWIRKVDGRF
jgi:CheY-like chemotaxis protein